MSRHRKELMGGYLVILLHTEQTKGEFTSVRLDNQSSVLCWEDESRISDSSKDTRPDYWDAQCVSSTGSWTSVTVTMHCLAHLTLFSSLLEVSDLQHASVDPICNRGWLGVIFLTFKMLYHSLREQISMHISIILITEPVPFQLGLAEDSNFSNNYTPIARQIHWDGCRWLTFSCLCLALEWVIRSCRVCIIM